MSTAERVKQGGSAITYIIVGVILAIGLVGSIYFARQRGNIARKEQAIAAYEQQTEQVANTNTNDTKSDSSSEEGKTNTEVAVNNENTNSETNSSSDLPQTGPGDVLLNGVVTFIVISSIASYLLSLRRRACYL